MAAERTAHDHPRYHHGRSPAAWAGVWICLAGFLIGTVGFLVGPGAGITPHWLVIGIGAAVIAVGCLMTVILRAVGLGND